MADHFTSTVDGAAAYERYRAVDDYASDYDPAEAAESYERPAEATVSLLDDPWQTGRVNLDKPPF